MSKVRSHAAARDPHAFRKGFCIYLGVLALIFAAALILLWFAMARHQDKVDLTEAEETAAQIERIDLAAAEDAVKRAREDAFISAVEGMDTADWVEVWFSQNPGTSNDTAAVAAAVEEAFRSGDTEYFRAADWTAEAPVYVVKRGDDRLAEISLTGHDTDWDVSEVRVFLAGPYSASITAPSGCTVCCGETVLDDRWVTERKTAWHFEEYTDELVNPRETLTYAAEGLFSEAALTVKAPEGYTLCEDETGQQCLSPENRGDLAERAETFVQRLTKYYLAGSTNTYNNMCWVLELAKNNSQAWRIVSTSYDGTIWRKPCTADYQCETTVGNIIEWADNCISVDVKCVASGYFYDYREEVDSTYRIYFLDTGSGYALCGLEDL